jgi:SMC interacting uncharacterized protein involved in chromosome segregation
MVMASSPQGLIGAHVGDLGDLFRATPISTSLTTGEGQIKLGEAKRRGSRKIVMVVVIITVMHHGSLRDFRVWRQKRVQGSWP